MMAWRIHLDRARRDQDGFSLVEVLVAIMVFTVVGVFMAGIMSSSLRGIMLSRQRASATADANNVLETARSLSFPNVGMVVNDPTLDSDPAITTNSPTNRTYNGEPIIFAQDSNNHPFNPHIRVVERSPSTLTRAVYVTGIDTSADGVPDVARVTVVVAWDRSPVQGVANSVTASTIIAPNSPGTHGNPPQGSGVPPLLGTASARSADAVVEASLGLGANLDLGNAAVARIYGVRGSGSNRLDAWSNLSCSQQGHRIEGANASSGNVTAANSANSASNPGPHDTGLQTQNQSSPGIFTTPLSATSQTLTGAVRCISSGVTSSSTLPHQTGTGSAMTSTTSTGVRVGAGSAGLALDLGNIDLVAIRGGTADQSTAQSNPSAREMTATATHGLAGIDILKPTSPLGLLGTNAIIQVMAYEGTVQSTASATSGSTPAVVAGQPLRIRILNGLNIQAGGLACSPVSGTNYCEITVHPTTQGTIPVTGNLDVGPPPVCLPIVGCTPSIAVVRLQVDVSITINPAKAQTTQLGGGIATAYRSEYSPLSITARMKASDIASLSSTRLDVRTSVDVGSLVTCAKHGVYPGGC